MINLKIFVFNDEIKKFVKCMQKKKNKHLFITPNNQYQQYYLEGIYI